MIVLAACAAALVIAWHIWAVPYTDPVYGLFHNGIDTRVYRGGAVAVWDHMPLYDKPVYRVWQFTYPPFAALLMFPLAGFSVHTAMTLWNIGNVVCLFLLVLVCMRGLAFRIDLRLVVFTVLVTIASTVLEPIHTTLWNGQINIVLALIVVADLVRRNSTLRGIGVGLAAGVKLTPIFYVAHLITTRRFRAAAVAVITFAATIVLGIALLGGEGRRFWTEQLTQTGRIGRLDAPANQTFRGYFARLATFDVAHPPSWLWLPIGLIVGILGLWAAHAAYRTGAGLLAVSITGMTSCAVGPFSWGHHWVWVLPLLLISVVHAVDTTRRREPLTWLWWLAPRGDHRADVHLLAVGGAADHRIRGQDDRRPRLRRVPRVLRIRDRRLAPAAAVDRRRRLSAASTRNHRGDARLGAPSRPSRCGSRHVDRGGVMSS
ncbi:glycosyltransferase 87 family protein [Gordonia humi]|uniref:glycosyltransferase 87 family protein n=1 Tax=Gordonia humi TaxID=686429 RepID=UPI00361E5D7A